MEKTARVLSVAYLIGLLVLFLYIWLNLFPENSFFFKHLRQVSFFARYFLAGITTSTVFWVSYFVHQNFLSEPEYLAN